MKLRIALATLATVCMLNGVSYGQSVDDQALNVFCTSLNAMAKQTDVTGHVPDKAWIVNLGLANFATYGVDEKEARARILRLIDQFGSGDAIEKECNRLHLYSYPYGNVSSAQ